MGTYYQWQQHKLYLNCYLQPRAAKDEFIGPYEENLKIRITAPPVDGKANKHLVKFIARQFQVSASKVTLVRGATSKYKCLCIDDPGFIPQALDIVPP